MQVKYYTPGNSGFLELENINEEDKNYILENDLVIELEQLLTNDFVVYLRSMNDKEEDELIELAKGRDCNTTIADIVKKYKNKLSGEKNV